MKNVILTQLCLILALGALGYSSLTQAQFCNNIGTPESVSSESFDINENVAIDRRSNLMWMRCPLGLQWDSSISRCVNIATQKKKYNWQDALKLADDYSTLINGMSYNDWRLPNVRELMSIVNTRCIAPAFSTNIFPFMPASFESGFWTSSPYQSAPPTDPNLPLPPVEAWFVKSALGETSHDMITKLNFVILVRSLP